MKKDKKSSRTQATTEVSPPTTTSKYPSTPHLPFSPGTNSDDTILHESIFSRISSQPSPSSWLVGSEVVITEKLDGANCCLRDGVVYGRTHSHPADHPSFGPIVAWYHSISCNIPSHLSLFGENMFGIHSMEYDRLNSFFYLFAIYDSSTEQWWSWDETVVFAREYFIPVVPLRHRGSFNSAAQLREWMEMEIKQRSALSTCEVPEGFVVRVPGRFAEEMFELSLAKYVRRNFVQTQATWRKNWRKAKLVADQSGESLWS